MGTPANTAKSKAGGKRARREPGARKIDALDASVYTVPTDQPEADDTLEWHATTMVIGEVRSGDPTGVGYTYAHQATAQVIADSFGIPVSAHCAPLPHAHVCSAVPLFEHVEYFHDHVHIESMFFDGLPKLHEGALQVDAHRPGLGVTLKRQDVERYRVDP